jgi:hypothetical protein
MRRRVVTFDFDSTLLWWGVTRGADGDIEDMVPMGKNPDIWPRFSPHRHHPQGAAQGRD